MNEAADGIYAKNPYLNACLMAYFDGTVVPDWLRMWLDNGLGAVGIAARNVRSAEQLRAITAELREHNPTVVITCDEEGGEVTTLQARDGSWYPGSAALGAVGDPELTRQVAAGIGHMLAEVGITLTHWPVLDLAVSPFGPIGVRSFGVDPEVVAAHVMAAVQGLRTRGVVACAKHFPCGYGREHRDPNDWTPRVDISLRGLKEADMIPYMAAIASDVGSIMTGHVLCPQIDDVPVTISARFLMGILRRELGFEGVIVTDALDMWSIARFRNLGSSKAALLALDCGADLLLLPGDRNGQLDALRTLLDAIDSRELLPWRVEQSALRVQELGRSVQLQPTGRSESWLGVEIADRALVRDLDAVRLPLPSASYVIDASGTYGGAPITSEFSLLEILQARRPSVDGIKVSEESLLDLDTVAAAAGRRPVVLVVRDAHRHGWQQELITGVTRQWPDAIVVGTGTAHDREFAPGHYLGTLGTGRANLVAAAGLLLSGN